MDGDEISLRERGWKLISINHYVLICCILGLVATINETDTSIVMNLDKLWKLDIKGFQSSLVYTVKCTLAAAVMIKGLTKEMYIACYMVTIYTFLGGNKSLALPWLILSSIRSILVEVVSAFTGIFLCAHYYNIKFSCLDFVISKAVSLACSGWLWAIVYEWYSSDSTLTNHRPRQVRRHTSSLSQGRSLDSVLAEAIVEWFLEEAERCNRFDSRLAFDEDISKFEEGLANRAANFLEMTPEEIFENTRSKSDRNKRTVLKKTNSSQTDGMKLNETEFNKQDLILSSLDSSLDHVNESDSQTDIYKSSLIITDIDMENKNPLRKFPYLPRVSVSGSEFGGDTAIGNKSVEVQTVPTGEEDQTPRKSMMKHAKQI